MKKFFNLFIGRQITKLEQCTPLKIENEESDALFGGFKEYVPPIYETDAPADSIFKTTDLLIDINQRL
jgi:hypothetical protein